MILSPVLQLLETRRLLSNSIFGVIGDFGYGDANETAVANMVKGWSPDHILTLGDNNYQTGSASTIDRNIGYDYHDYIFNYTGSYGAGSATRRFYPSLGNHDWGNVVPNAHGADPYLNFFNLPGNERYYDFVQGPVHFFALDSDYNEPDGNTSTSVQAQWLQQKLAAATEPHKIVYFHHAPYSSGDHGNSTWMQWPFSQWGATAVLAGHEHSYQRMIEEGIPYFVNGLGGAEETGLGAAIPGTMNRYNANFGAMRVRADDTTMRYQFYSVDGVLRDQYNQVVSGQQQATVSVVATRGLTGEGSATPGQLVFSRTGATGSSLTVNVQIAGSGTNGTDYPTVSNTVTFPSGVSTVTMDIAPTDDSAVEASETLQITISASDDYNYDAYAQTAKVTITDNDVYTTTIAPAGSGWRYSTTGSTPSNWNALSYDDSSWGRGNAPMGYGDPGMATTLSYGSDANNKYITSYFRKSFIVPNAAAVTGLDLFLRRDDGAVVYLNGNEIVRSNMPTGTISYSTLASSAVADADETTFYPYSIPPSSLRNGINVIAVEIHQNTGNSSDLSFDLKLSANVDVIAPAPPSAPLLMRGGNEVTHPEGVPTNEQGLHLYGFAEAGSAVDIFAGDTLIASGTSDETGRYEFVTSILPESVHNLFARATDVAGNAGEVSGPSVVVIDRTSPVIVSSERVIAYGPATYRFRLSEEVEDEFEVSDVTLRNVVTSETCQPLDVTFDDDQKMLIVHLSRGGQMIAGGSYEVVVRKDAFVDEAGNIAAEDAIGSFDFLAGDANEDGRVDTADFNLLAGEFGERGSLADGDLNFTGRIDSADFNLLISQYGKRLPATSSMPAPAIFATASHATNREDSLI